MTDIDDESLSAVGADLLSHAQEFGELIRLPVTTQLFPWLLLASRRMTTREMSAWLAKAKGVKLSAPMITKGLQRPDLHLSRIAEFVQPLAAFVAAAQGMQAEGLLFAENPKSGKSALQELSSNICDAPDDAFSDSVREAVESLMEIWEPIPEEVKYMCRQYFDFIGDSHGGNSDDSQDEA